MSDNVRRSDGSEPRPPKDVKDLLRYAIEVGQNNVDPEESAPAPCTEERRKFLEEVISTLSLDVPAELAKSISQVKDNPNNCDLCVVALDTILEYVDNIDFARDFLKLGGFQIVGVGLRSEFVEVRWRIAEILADSCQNFPLCQEEAVKCNVFERLLTMLADDPDDNCKVKALYAISSIVRNNDHALSEFIRLKGLSILKDVMTSNIEKLRDKSIFFFRVIANQNCKILDEVVKMDFVQHLATLISSEHSRNHEHLIASLLAIVKQSPPAAAVFQTLQAQLKPALLHIIQTYSGDPAYDEEVEDARLLSELL